MFLDCVKIIGKSLAFALPYLPRIRGSTRDRTASCLDMAGHAQCPKCRCHRGLVRGCGVGKGLAETLPTGFKVVWIEKNSHLNYSFNFPRYSVVTGHEHKAFIPYDGVSRGAPTGIVTRIQDTAVGLTEDQVLLASGDKIDYTYLAIATAIVEAL